jgi:fluoroacetyl-CoA thioesterase
MEVGILGSMEIEVDEEKSAEKMGSGNLPVFATPAMIALIEETAWKSVEEHLQKGQSTVGTNLEISHLSATPLGMNVLCQTKLIEVDGRKLVFEAKVYDKEALIGKGKHERYIIDTEKFMENTKNKFSVN